MDQINFNILEADIERLSKEVKEKKSQPQFQNFSDKDFVKQSVATTITSSTSNFSVQQDFDKIEQEVLPNYMKEASPELKLKVEELVELVFKKGIISAAQEAQKYGPYVVDAFHDAITDKLYEELKKRNLI